MWEDEKTLCYQVEANNVSVVRRADNNMINGTKLLNVAKMTRGRRDGILKAEKTRNVVKIGSMHLKGVWIPFERALIMAQREGISDQLYPLFVKDIQKIIQQGVPTVKMGQFALNSIPSNKSNNNEINNEVPDSPNDNDDNENENDNESNDNNTHYNYQNDKKTSNDPSHSQSESESQSQSQPQSQTQPQSQPQSQVSQQLPPLPPQQQNLRDDYYYTY